MTDTATRYTTTTGSGFRTDILPWRLYQKAKRLVWDPVDIDMASDVADWQALDEMTKRIVLRLATTFMVGEEAVTLDIVPLVRAIGDEGRTEEAMFLTTFLGDEAKHAELFRTWFETIGEPGPFDHLLTDAQRRIFDDVEPKAMRRLDTDRSPEAFLDASLTYNHFVEGVLAMTGYWAWQRLFTVRGVFTGLREGISLIQRDERRHLAYGTYLCRRIVAEHPETWDFVERRMGELRELGLAFVDGIGAAIFADLSELAEPGSDGDLESVAKAVVGEFTEYGEQQLERRLHAISVARDSSVADVESGTVEEELEAELELA